MKTNLLSVTRSSGHRRRPGGSYDTAYIDVSVDRPATLLFDSSAKLSLASLATLSPDAEKCLNEMHTMYR